MILEPRSGLVLGLSDLFGAGFEAISGPGNSPRPFLAGLAALPDPFSGWFWGSSGFGGLQAISGLALGKFG